MSRVKLSHHCVFALSALNAITANIAHDSHTIHPASVDQFARQPVTLQSIAIPPLALPLPPSTRPSTHNLKMSSTEDPDRQHALTEYKKKLIELREWEAKLKTLRGEIKGLQHDYDVSEDNIKALQSVGQIIGEVLKQLDEERCMLKDAHGFCLPSSINVSLIRSISHRQSVKWP